jgi:SSS family solute:Na+ symporter
VSGSVILGLGIAIALYYSTQKDPLFVQVQRVFFFIAPPFAVIFTLGLLWNRANAAAALTTVALGFPFSAFLTLYAFPTLDFLKPYNTYQHPALGAWFFCMAVMIVTSLLTAPPPLEKTAGIIWSRAYAALPAEERQRYSGLKDWRLWWLLFVASVLAIYGFFVWFRLQHPVKMLPW